MGQLGLWMSSDPPKRTPAPVHSRMLVLDSLKDCKVALSWYPSVVVDEGVGVLHGSPASSVAVLGDADPERRKLRRLRRHKRMTVQGLHTAHHY